MKCSTGCTGICLSLALAGSAHVSTAQSVDTIFMRVTWQVTEGRHPTADSLGRLSGVAVDRQGTVYVSDMSEARVWVFDAQGRSVGSIGRRGRRPGEFESPTGAAIAPDGRLVIRDVLHVSRFSTDSRTGRLTRFDDSFRGPLFPNWTSTRTSRFTDDGRMFHPAYAYVDGSLRSARYDIYSARGQLLDFLIVPPFPSAPTGEAIVRLGPSDAKIVRGLGRVPFAPQPFWDITRAGTLIRGDGTSYRLIESDRSGRVLREIRRNAPVERIPPTERRDSAQALRARIDSLNVPLNQVRGMPDEVRAVRLPENFPAINGVFAAPDGMIWVRRWTAASSGRTIFDVFDRTGTYTRVVVLPQIIASLPTPVLTLSYVAAVAIDPESGTHSVVHFSPHAAGRSR